MSIINQPFQGQLGDILISELKNGYTNFTIFSAFAKNSGVLRLKESIENFKLSGGYVKAFIGIDLDGTSYEALLNLFSLCNELYVIHSENFSTTYHSKIYLLEGSSTAWCAIGSNNLTGGGLWTNFESCSIQSYDSSTGKNELKNIYSIIEKYSDTDYSCSIKINSIDDINTLLEANYISKEISQKIENISKRVSQKKKQKKNSLFGSEKITIPTIITTQKPHKLLTKSSTSDIDYIITPTAENVPAFTNEQFWFETKAVTGGSANILDLSKLGKIEYGSVKGTPYEYSDPTLMYGGVKFFDVDPEDTTIEKNIIINYLGKDYFPSKIEYTSGNGSWRIHLAGEPNDDSDKLSKFGNRGDFAHKILVFEKITPDYYSLSVLPEAELNHVKSLSRVWALNGKKRNANAKAYGML